MDELAVPDINSDVADIAAAGVEAEDIARLQIALVDVYAVFRLVGRDAVERIAEVLVYVVYKPRAVKSGLR